MQRLSRYLALYFPLLLSTLTLWFACSPLIPPCLGEGFGYEGDIEPLEGYVRSLYRELALKEIELPLSTFRYALIGYLNLKGRGVIRKEGIITIIDLSRSCNERRFYVIDLLGKRVLYQTHVSHGIGSGTIYAQRFSNRPGSCQSPLGFFVTGDAYEGEYGYSLYLDGMEVAFNDKSRSRGIVIHGAPYVSQATIRRYGRIGTSRGCPTLPIELCAEIIDTIKGGTCLFQFAVYRAYLDRSTLLDPETAARQYREEYSRAHKDRLRSASVPR